ncbi:hypothetical protein RJT34_27575 [Clitoria ternatea]|uniref:Uncharacterized protein n=1 Tax=Clitoria ternatea TaxID=43366 RepID=A0AAN9I9T1_CLITE
MYDVPYCSYKSTAMPPHIFGTGCVVIFAIILPTLGSGNDIISEIEVSDKCKIQMNYGSQLLHEILR